MRRLAPLILVLLAVSSSSFAQIITRNDVATAQVGAWLNAHAENYGPAIVAVRDAYNSGDITVEIFNNLGERANSTGELGGVQINQIRLDSKMWTSCTWINILLIHENFHITAGHPPRPNNPDDWTTQDWCNEYAADCAVAEAMAGASAGTPDPGYDCDVWDDFKDSALNSAKKNCPTANSACDDAVAAMDTYCDE